MAIIRCYVTIKSATGNAVQTFPSTSVKLAKIVGKNRANEIQGSFQVDKCKPYEYQPK